MVPAEGAGKGSSSKALGVKLSENTEPEDDDAVPELVPCLVHALSHLMKLLYWNLSIR